MSFNYSQNFESLNLGDLNGQDEWITDPCFQVQDSIVNTGIKALQFSGYPWTATRITDLFETGALSFYFRCVNSAGVYAAFNLYYSGLDSPGIVIIFTANKIYLYDKYKDELIDSGYTLTPDTWFKIGIEFDKDLGEGGQFRVSINDESWSDWLGAGGGAYSNFPGSDRIAIGTYSSVICYLDDIEAIITTSPNLTSPKNYNGYLAFIQQYIRHKIAGTDPWANPDGTLI